MIRLIQKAMASANSSWIHGDIILVRLDLVDDAQLSKQITKMTRPLTTQYTEVELTDAHAHRNS
jgi:putative ribosome biogenesis GTPase RsgA